MTTRAPLTPLEDATLRFVLANAGEADGWLDLTRVSSLTARMLPDVRRAVARLLRRGMLVVDDDAPNTDRWLRFVVPGVSDKASGAPRPVPREPVP
jgi:hypothetical protein